MEEGAPEDTADMVAFQRKALSECDRIGAGQILHRSNTFSHYGRCGEGTCGRSVALVA